MHIPPMVNLKTAGLRQSPCLQKMNQMKDVNVTLMLTKLCAFGVILSTCLEPSLAFSTGQAAVNSFIHKCNVIISNFDRMLDLLPSKENKKCYTFKEMLAQPDRNQFLEAMLKETAKHESRDHWNVIPKSSMPQGTKPIQAIWSFKRKRFPDSSSNKHKP